MYRYKTLQVLMHMKVNKFLQKSISKNVTYKRLEFLLSTALALRTVIKDNTVALGDVLSFLIPKQ